MMVVFDWDGTLGNSIEAITGALSRASEVVGLPVLTKASYQSVIGLSLDAAAHGLYPNIETEKRVAYVQAYRDSFDMAEAARLFPQATELLESLYGVEGVSLGVATGKSREGLDTALELTGLAYLFRATMTASEAESKPSPDMLHQLGAIEGDSIIMVGDSVLDVAMGVAAKAYTIGVTWGVASAQALDAAGADAVVSDFAQLRAELERQGAL